MQVQQPSHVPVPRPAEVTKTDLLTLKKQVMEEVRREIEEQAKEKYL